MWEIYLKFRSLLMTVVGVCCHGEVICAQNQVAKKTKIKEEEQQQINMITSYVLPIVPHSCNSNSAPSPIIHLEHGQK